MRTRKFIMIWLWWNIFLRKFVYELLVMCPRACSLYTHRRLPASVKLLCQLLGPRVIRTLWAVEGLVGACWDFEGVCIGLRNNWVTDGWMDGWRWAGPGAGPPRPGWQQDGRTGHRVIVSIDDATSLLGK